MTNTTCKLILEQIEEPVEKTLTFSNVSKDNNVLNDPTFD